MHFDDTAPDTSAALERLHAAGDPLLAQALTGLGWNPQEVIGVDTATIEDIARQMDRDHRLAQKLWAEGLRETRLLAIRLEEPKKTQADQLDRWVHQLTHEELTTYLVDHLLTKSPATRHLVPRWAASHHPLVRNAGFRLLNRLGLDDDELDPKARFPGYFTLSGLQSDGADAPTNAIVRTWRAIVRYMGRRNRRTGQQAVKRAQEAQLLWEQDKIQLNREYTDRTNKQ